MLAKPLRFPFLVKKQSFLCPSYGVRRQENGLLLCLRHGKRKRKRLLLCLQCLHCLPLVMQARQRRQWKKRFTIQSKTAERNYGKGFITISLTLFLELSCSKVSNGLILEKKFSFFFVRVLPLNGT